MTIILDIAYILQLSGSAFILEMNWDVFLRVFLSIYISYRFGVERQETILCLNVDSLDPNFAHNILKYMSFTYFFVFYLKLIWSLFLWVKFNKPILVTLMGWRRPAKQFIIRTNDNPVHRRNELTRVLEKTSHSLQWLRFSYSVVILDINSLINSQILEIV